MHVNYLSVFLLLGFLNVFVETFHNWPLSNIEFQRENGTYIPASSFHPCGGNEFCNSRIHRRSKLNITLPQNEPIKICGWGLFILHEQDNLVSSPDGSDTHAFYFIPTNTDDPASCFTAAYLNKIKSVEFALPNYWGSGPLFTKMWDGKLYSIYKERHFGGEHVYDGDNWDKLENVATKSFLLIGTRTVWHKLTVYKKDTGKPETVYRCWIPPEKAQGSTLCLVPDYGEMEQELKSYAREGYDMLYTSFKDNRKGCYGWPDIHIPEENCFFGTEGLVDIPGTTPPTTTTTMAPTTTTEEVTEVTTTLHTTTTTPTTTTTAEPTTLPPCPPAPTKDFDPDENDIIKIRLEDGNGGSKGSGGKGNGRSGTNARKKLPFGGKSEYNWMLELFERSLSILELICGPPLLPKLYLKVFAGIFYKINLNNLDKVKNLHIEEAELMEIYYDLHSCRKIVDGGKYSEITNNTLMQMMSYRKLTELKDVISPKFSLREDLDYVMELSWLMSNLVGQICSDAKNFQANIFLRYFIAYDKLYFQPLKEQWRNATANDDFYKYAFGGFSLKKSMIKLALCTYNAFSFTQSPLHYTRVIDDDKYEFDK